MKDTAENRVREIFDSLTVEFLIAEIGDGKFAFEKDDVKVIVPFRRYSRIPRAPEEVIGMIFYEGMILPIIDAGKVLKKEVSTEGSEVMVLSAEGMRAGLLIKGVPRMIEVQMRDIMKVEGENFISSYISAPEGKIPCVNVKALLNFIRSRMNE